MPDLTATQREPRIWRSLIPLLSCGVLLVACSSPRQAPSFHINGPAVGRWVSTAQPGEALGANPAGAFGGVDWFGWGGFCTSLKSSNLMCTQGAVFHPTAGAWQSVSNVGAPSPRRRLVVVSTDQGFFMWGGICESELACGDGAIYQPLSDSWSPVTSTGAPSPRFDPFAYVTPTEVIVWGGAQPTPPSQHLPSVSLGDGGAYNLIKKTWRPLSSIGAPSIRYGSAVVAAGTDMVVWGGVADHRVLSDGAIYHPTTDTWEPIETTGAPEGRFLPLALWMGREMLVFGGSCGTPDSIGAFKLCNDPGFAYDPAKRHWRTIAAGLQPSSGPVAAWTGTRAFIWGGSGTCCSGESCTCNQGGLYDPVADSWQAVQTDGAPTNGPAYWIGDSVLIVPATDSTGIFPARYFPPINQ